MPSPAQYLTVFQKGQRAILVSVGDVQHSLRDYPACRTKLAVLLEKLLVHWKKQDESFWTALAEVFATDRPAQKIVEFLVFDLKELKVKYLAFEDRYLLALPGGERRTFPKDGKDFLQAVLDRIQMEEEYLFPLLKRWQHMPENDVPE